MFEKVNITQSKHIKKLHRKKNRQTFNEFIVEGTKSVLEFLQSKYVCKGIYATEDWYTKNYELVKGFSLFIVNHKQLDQLSTFKNPQPVLAVFEIIKLPNVVNNEFILFLEDIRDPGNLGTIIRTAEWFGLKEIYCSETCADKYNSKVIQASMGSTSRIKVSYLEYVKLQDKFMSHIPVLADMGGISLKEYSWGQRNILIIGNEANGVSNNLKSLVKNSLTIKKNGKAESLNASISTAIILSHYF